MIARRRNWPSPATRTGDEMLRLLVGEVAALRQRVEALERRSHGAGRSFVADKSTLDPFIAACCEAWGLTEEQLLGRSRTPVVLRARFALYRLACQRSHLSLHDIGRAIARDATTVRHGSERAASLAVSDADFSGRYHRAATIAWKSMETGDAA